MPQEETLTEREQDAVDILSEYVDGLSVNDFADYMQVSTEYGRQVLNSLLEKDLVVKFKPQGSRAFFYKLGTAENDTEPDLQIEVAQSANYMEIIDDAHLDGRDDVLATNMYEWIRDNEPTIFHAINTAFEALKWPKVRAIIMKLEELNLIEIEKVGNKKLVRTAL